MAAHRKFITVNLLSADAFSESIFGKVLMWALSIGRYIVVFTELIVILSFLSRFKLDRDLTDLNSQINQQLLVIDSYGDLEHRFKDLQLKLSFMRERLAGVDVETTFESVILNLPPDVKLKNITTNRERVTLSATSLSSQGFYQFVNNLKANKAFSDLKVSNVSQDEEVVGGIVFDLSLDIRKTGT